jgi:hypothetical protein
MHDVINDDTSLLMAGVRQGQEGWKVQRIVTELRILLRLTAFIVSCFTPLL